MTAQGGPGLRKLCPGELRGCQNEVPGGPGDVPGRSRHPGGALGSAGARFRTPLGTILGSILEPFLVCFVILFRSDFWIIFSCSFGCFRRPFWSHFGGVWCPNFDIKSVTFSRTSPERMWEPRVATTGSKSWIFIGGLFKIEGRPFRVGVPPGAVFEAKMVPEWRSESTKTC